LFKDRLKTILGGASAHGTSTPNEPVSSHASGSAKATGPSYTRHSNGLDQFFTGLRGQVGLNILDFAGASQANVSFITNLGHRLSSEDYLRSLEITFGNEQFYENQDDPEQAEKFLHENLNFPEGNFDGALVWDALQFLSPPLLQATVERLHYILRPGSSLLAFFHADEKAEQVPLYSYRIADEKNLLLTPRGSRKRAQFFNNRGLEKLFQGQTVKFFLTRDNLREIIVRR
jgi:hypothetical protein